jgi:hypothetical protein
VVEQCGNPKDPQVVKIMVDPPVIALKKFVMSSKLESLSTQPVPPFIFKSFFLSN